MARFENINSTRTNGGWSTFVLDSGNFRITNPSTDAATHNVLTIPPKTVVLNVYNQVVSPATTTCTATVGDGDSAVGWDASTNLTASANVRTGGTPGTDAFATTGKYYPNGDTIDYAVTMSTANDVAIVRCQAVCYKIGNKVV
jgi:hypothetical protein